MKIFREYRTVGDYFYCDCTFLPDEDSSVEEQEDLLFDQTLRMSFLLRYPKKVKKVPVYRFECKAHVNLSPILVAQEATRFLSLITNMLSQ